MLCNAAAFGDVVWERDQISATARFGDKGIDAQYLFKNTGKSTLIVQDLSTDCDCTTAHPTERAIPAGESADIDVHFTVGYGTGRTEKNISVLMTDETGVFQKVLKLVVTIPAWVRATPSLLTWPIGSATESTSEIYVHQELAGHRLRLEKTPEAFVCTLSCDPDNKLHYWLRIAPKVIDSPFHHEIQLSFEDLPDQILAVVTLVVR